MTTMTGGCRCGAVRYEAEGEPVHSSVCHCSDCRKSAGAPYVAWLAVPSDKFRVTEGAARQWSVDGQALRHFCEACGTGLYYVNETVLPGLVDLQIATLDDPEAWPPQVQVQTAEKLAWSDGVPSLHGFERYPSGS